MDETTKTLIGTISGFLIAFFAEPIKTYFQISHKIKNIRKMLYQETFENYSFLQNTAADDISSETYQLLATSLIRTSGYEYAISNEITIYYQLKEATLFNKLYSLLEHIIEHGAPLEFRKEIPDIYKDLLLKAIKSNDIDLYLLRKLMGKKEVKSILENLKQKNP